MPKIGDLKETALYVDDLERAIRFYRDVLGIPILVEDTRFCALDVNGQHVLLLFRRGASNTHIRLRTGVIPPHDGSGPVHAGFAIESSELMAWESHLQANQIEVLGRVDWPRGGCSIYFRDPDGHLLELLTPGVWATY